MKLETFRWKLERGQKEELTLEDWKEHGENLLISKENLLGETFLEKMIHNETVNTIPEEIWKIIITEKVLLTEGRFSPQFFQLIKKQ